MALNYIYLVNYNKECFQYKIYTIITIRSELKDERKYVRFI